MAGSLTLLSFSLSCICLAMLTLAHQGSSSVPNFSLAQSQKANIAACRAAYLTLENCYVAARIAVRTHQVRILMGPECCKAAEALDFGCWPRSLVFNPFFPPFLKSHCSAFHNRPQTTPFGAAQFAKPLETSRKQAIKSESDEILASSSEGV
ncbi:hypothetical protein QVD17_22957 [Tagetes erecta]|uniref:Prolamin-like domain-containing protein n=1 Tax=Tagetes erecta TaxID=13708 RepID=A0AAD8KDW3_TARER|nr:hypothetical protein QVD17_22957 [Tagetes erecta]